MMTGWQPTPDEVLELFLSIVLIGGVLTFLSDRLVAGLAASQLAASDLNPATVLGPEQLAGDRPTGERMPSDTALLERLPAHVRNDILCLQVEDHYVRVHSSQTSAMVLMRFSDALLGLDHIPGSQCIALGGWRPARLPACAGRDGPRSSP